MRLPVLICCLFLAGPVAARMYQWTSPATGTPNLSGTPPAWYRAPHAGPRVLVFERGQLIDDTAIAVSDRQRLELRSAAFGANAAPAVAPSKPAAAAAGESAAPAAPVPAPTPATPATPGATPITAKADALKAMIDAWDQRQLEQARTLLELMPDSKTAPATGR